MISNQVADSLVLISCPRVRHSRLQVVMDIPPADHGGMVRTNDLINHPRLVHPSHRHPRSACDHTRHSAETQQEQDFTKRPQTHDGGQWWGRERMYTPSACDQTHCDVM